MRPVDAVVEPAAVLQRLQDGNRKWVSRARSAHAGRVPRHAPEHAHPLATVVVCSDQLEAPEEVLGVRYGDLLVAQTPGPFPCDAVSSTIMYGVHALGTPLVLVMAHEGCPLLDNHPAGLAALPVTGVERTALRTLRAARTSGEPVARTCARTHAGCLRRDLALPSGVHIVAAILDRTGHLSLL